MADGRSAMLGRKVADTGKVTDGRSFPVETKGDMVSLLLLFSSSRASQHQGHCIVSPIKSPGQLKIIPNKNSLLTSCVNSIY